MNQVDYVHNLFETYYRERNNDKRNNEKVMVLRAEIEGLVLTGEEIMESGITDFSELYQELEKEREGLYEKLERYNQAHKKGLRILAQRKNSEMDNFLIGKITKIEKIIREKEGTIIDEIRDAIR